MKKAGLLLISFLFLLSICSFSGIAQDKKKSKETKKTEAVKTQEKAKKESVVKKEDASNTVYVLETGNAYHKKNCRLVKTGKKGISLEEAKKQKYEPCKVCKPPK